MEIKRINIENELMDTIVKRLFYPIKDVSIFDDNTKLPIEKEEVEKFATEWNKIPETTSATLPYFSLTSDNSNNELQIYIQAYDENFNVTINDISLRTSRYIRYGEKYNFEN